jgi:hypothetical protein
MLRRPISRAARGLREPLLLGSRAALTISVASGSTHGRPTQRGSAGALLPTVTALRNTSGASAKSSRFLPRTLASMSRTFVLQPLLGGGQSHQRVDQVKLDFSRSARS